ncbi:MAG: tRNA-dihydrouridine synthase [Clostridiales Family XIII bacterium]|jgi:tRNA-dihydrouridine synthase B|nr:tRNA-dihydrouridine synthase [Clostridiales Family XIII bacterium]
MAGVTDDVFRFLCGEQGAALVYSEMVSAKALHYGDQKSLELLAHSSGSAPVVYQLFGSDPDVMAEAVAKIDRVENGVSDYSGDGSVNGSWSSSLDYILKKDKIISCTSYDINMGCPVSKVVRNGEGSALMKDPDRAVLIVEAMSRQTQRPVTVKIRAGWDAASTDAGAAVGFAQAMEQAGAAAIAVHGRTREQYYGGKADWGVVAHVKDAVNIPVIGSGDVMNAADAHSMLRETGCDYVMIARGAIGNPWIFADAAALSRGEAPRQSPSAGERARMFLRHAHMLEADKGEYIAVREMRKHSGWYFKGLPGAASFRAKANAAESITVLASLVDAAFLS